MISFMPYTFTYASYVFTSICVFGLFTSLQLLKSQGITRYRTGKKDLKVIFFLSIIWPIGLPLLSYMYYKMPKTNKENEHDTR